jgi:hypothetical protein
LDLIEHWQTAARLLRQYGNSAEEECAARASYHQMQRDEAEAHRWRLIKGLVERLRKGERAPLG